MSGACAQNAALGCGPRRGEAGRPLYSLACFALTCSLLLLSTITTTTTLYYYYYYYYSLLLLLLLLLSTTITTTTTLYYSLYIGGWGYSLYIEGCGAVPVGCEVTGHRYMFSAENCTDG